MSSRWAVDEGDEDHRAQRKREKDEKRRLKHEKGRDSSTIQTPAEQVQSQEESERPGKRQRTVSSSPREDVQLLELQITHFGQARDISHYDVLNRIEEGSYGFVSRARERATGDIVALKKLKIDHNNIHEGFPVTGLREIQTLRSCTHPHIVNLREVVAGSTLLKDVYLVMDFVEHDLKDLLQDMNEPFSPSEVKTLMLQLCSALEYLHDHWIMHRDLKTSNLLLSNRGELKLADFGMARYTANPPPKLTQLVVTLWYRAPELLLGTEDYGFEIDIWSLGCVFSELLTKEPLFEGKNEVGQLSAILDKFGLPTKDSWPAFRTLPNSKALTSLSNSRFHKPSKLSAATYPYLTQAGLDLLNEMLTLNPDNRPPISSVLAHAYFRDAPRPKAKEMFPTFPSKAGQEKRRRKSTPQAPHRGEAPVIDSEALDGIFNGREDEKHGAGFALRMG